MALTLTNLARTAYRQGDRESALLFLDESLSLARELTTKWTVGFALKIKGLLERDQGNYRQALVFLLESLETSLEQDNQQGIANCLGAVAGVAVMTQRPALAISLFAAAEVVREAIGSKMAGQDQAEYDRYFSLARQLLTDDDFQSAWNQGSVLTPEQLVNTLSQDKLLGTFRPRLFQQE